MLWKGLIEPGKCGDRLLLRCDRTSIERIKVAACSLRRVVQEVVHSRGKYKRPSLRVGRRGDCRALSNSTWILPERRYLISAARSSALPGPKRAGRERQVPGNPIRLWASYPDISLLRPRMSKM